MDQSVKPLISSQASDVIENFAESVYDWHQRSEEALSHEC